MKHAVKDVLHSIFGKVLRNLLTLDSADSYGMQIHKVPIEISCNQDEESVSQKSLKCAYKGTVHRENGVHLLLICNVHLVEDFSITVREDDN